MLVIQLIEALVTEKFEIVLIIALNDKAYLMLLVLN